MHWWSASTPHGSTPAATTKTVAMAPPRANRDLRLAAPQQILARERVQLDEAWAGDVVGVHDRGSLRIGDTLCTGKAVRFQGIPRFSPEHFAIARTTDVSRTKQFRKGVITDNGNDILGDGGEHRQGRELGADLLKQTRLQLADGLLQVGCRVRAGDVLPGQVVDGGEMVDLGDIASQGRASATQSQIGPEGRQRWNLVARIRQRIARVPDQPSSASV